VRVCNAAFCCPIPCGLPSHGARIESMDLNNLDAGYQDPDESALEASFNDMQR
jgi:hypothetical protein